MLEWNVSPTAYRSLLQRTCVPEAVVDYIVHMEVHLLGILCICGHPRVVDEEESRKSKVENPGDQRVDGRRHKRLSWGEA
jgi:hypothetical protein